MPKARKHQISLDATPYYHCISRCVRRAYLCGFDALSRRSYEHRRQWVEDRIILLAEVFSIDVCAYAVMSNHLHLVLHINKAKLSSWTDREVCNRWHRLFKGSALTQKYAKNKSLTKLELQAVELNIKQWRSNLSNISWFMRALNEPIARQANAEDDCTGRFWEGRFKSQALLDEKALAACMAYVDLNPIRAGTAKTLESSDYTSIKRRIAFEVSGKQKNNLIPFASNSRCSTLGGLQFKLKDYIRLVDWTSRFMIKEERGLTNSGLPPILNRLEIEPKQWLLLCTKFEAYFCRLAAFSDQVVRAAAKCLGYRRMPMRACI